MTVSGRYLYARIRTDLGEALVELEKVGPAFVSGRMACGVRLRAPQPDVTFVETTDLTEAERARFGLPAAVPA